MSIDKLWPFCYNGLLPKWMQSTNINLTKMTTKAQQNIESGLERIEEIKKNICACKPSQNCKAEVYEMWDGIFESEETDK